MGKRIKSEVKPCREYFKGVDGRIYEQRVSIEYSWIVTEFSVHVERRPKTKQVKPARRRDILRRFGVRKQ